MKTYIHSKPNQSDEWSTPEYAIQPILRQIFIKTLKENKTPSEIIIWCPFDTEDSNFVKLFRKWDFIVYATHKDNGEDFFSYEYRSDFDYIISNPPFSIKDEVLKKLYEIDIPFAMLLPIPSLSGIKRVELFKKGLELLIFDRRIDFNNKKGVSFNSGYFCKGILPQQLIFETLTK